MCANESIDWNDLRQGYNRIYKTCYRTVKTFLSKVYKANPSVHTVGKILGVSHSAVLYKMMDLKIDRLPKGHRGKTVFQERCRAIKNPEKLKPFEVAKIVGCSMNYAYVLPKVVAKWDKKNVS